MDAADAAWASESSGEGGSDDEEEGSEEMSE